MAADAKITSSVAVVEVKTVSAVLHELFLGVSLTTVRSSLLASENSMSLVGISGLGAVVMCEMVGQLRRPALDLRRRSRGGSTGF